MMSEFVNADGGFDIALWLSITGITEKGVKSIENNQINDLPTLLLFTSMDVDQLKLSVGDALRFKSGIVKLRAAKYQPPPLVDNEGKIVEKPVVEKKKHLRYHQESVFSHCKRLSSCLLAVGPL